jgi:hypothetical protein
LAAADVPRDAVHQVNRDGNPRAVRHSCLSSWGIVLPARRAAQTLHEANFDAPAADQCARVGMPWHAGIPRRTSSYQATCVTVCRPKCGTFSWARREERCAGQCEATSPRCGGRLANSLAVWKHLAALGLRRRWGRVRGMVQTGGRAGNHFCLASRERKRPETLSWQALAFSGRSRSRLANCYPALNHAHAARFLWK